MQCLPPPGHARSWYIIQFFPWKMNSMEHSSVNCSGLYVKVHQWGEVALNKSPNKHTSLFYVFHVFCINQMYFKKNKKRTRMYESNLIIWQTLTHFGHSCGHFQGGKNKNTINIIVCLDQYTVKVTKFWLNSRLKEYLKDMHKLLEDKDCSTCKIVLWMMHVEDTYMWWIMIQIGEWLHKRHSEQHTTLFPFLSHNKEPG